MLPSIFTFLFLFPCLILSSTTEDQRDIAPESLQFIQRMPCSEPQGRCSFKDFAELRGERNFLEEWMGLLYFDFYRYFSHDVLKVSLIPKVYVKLFRHKILFGQVLCDRNTTHIPSHAKLCKNMDPNSIYIFQNGKRTRYWWNFEKIFLNCTFVVSNFLALQYSGHVESLKNNSFDEALKQKWLANPDLRKFMLIVPLPNATLEVDTSVGFNDTESADRLRTLDLVGAVYQTIPDVRIFIMNETNSTGVKFWWYDSRWCPNLSESNCKHYRIQSSDFSENDADTFLCGIEKFSSGLDNRKTKIDLRPNSTASRWGESNHRLLLACPFIFFNADLDKYENIRSEIDNLTPKRFVGVAVIGNREMALNALRSLGADLELMNSKCLFKIHSELINPINTDVFSRMTSPTGLQVEFSETRPEETHLYEIFRYIESYNFSNDEKLSYKYLDTLALMSSRSRDLFSSPYLTQLNETEFQRRIAGHQPPATVLFYVQWSSPSMFARYVIFPSASNELASRFNLTERLYAVDCFNWNEVCQKQGIDHYPTVKFFVRGSSRRLETVVSLTEILRETFMLDMEPLLEAKTPEEVTGALKMSAQLMDHAVLGVGLKDAQVLEEFRKTAVAGKGKALFILLQHRDLPQDLQARIPNASVASYSGRLRPDLFIKDPPLHADLAQFVTEARFNRVMELTWTLFHEFQATKRPLLTLIVEMTPKFHILLSSLAIRRRGQFHVTWLYMLQKTPFPIFKDIKEPTIVLLQAGSIYRWRVKSFVEDETDCPIIGLELDLWLDSIKEGKKSPDEFVKERDYPAKETFENNVDYFYPRPEAKDPNKELREKQIKPNSTEMTEKDIGHPKVETARPTLPKSSTVQRMREDL